MAPEPSIDRRRALMLGLSTCAGFAFALTGCASTTDRAIDNAIKDERKRLSVPKETKPSPPADGATIRAQAWSFQGAPGRIIETPSFNLYTTLDRSELLDRLPMFLEQALANYRTIAPSLPVPKQRLTAYVLDTRSQWAHLTKQIMGPQAKAYLRIARGGFAAKGKGIYYDIGPRDTLAIAAHEGWHQYAQATFAEPMPVWLDEGLATQFEGFRSDPRTGNKPVFMPWANAERLGQLRRALGAREIKPLGEVLGSRPQNLLDRSARGTLNWYAQVWALIHFLREGLAGQLRPPLERMIVDAANGGLYARVAGRFGPGVARRARATRAGDVALRAYYPDEDLHQLDRAYRLSIVQMVQPATRQRTLEGFSPLT